MSVDALVAAAVKAAPPLTAEQAHRLAVALPPAPAGRTGAYGSKAA